MTDRSKIKKFTTENYTQPTNMKTFNITSNKRNSY